MKLIEIRYIIVSHFVFLSLPLLLNAQVSRDVQSPYLPGIHTISGIVFTPDRMPIGRSITVRAGKGGNDQIAWTNDDGQFAISGLANGTYTLTVDAGAEFEAATHRLEIALSRGSPAQTFHVNVQLRFKPGLSGKPAVIDAGLAGVPSKALEHYQNALAAKAKGDKQGAVSELLQAVGAYSEFAAAHSELGSQYQLLDQFEKSEEHLRVARKLKPDYETLGRLGITLVRLRKFEEAESMLREAIKINASFPVAHFYLGRSLVGQQKSAAAEPEFRAAINLGGAAMNEARRALANIYLQRDENEKGLIELEAYLVVNPAPPDEKRLRETIMQIRQLLRKEDKL